MPDDEPDYKKDGEIPPYDEYTEQILNQSNPWQPYKHKLRKPKEVVHPDGVVTD